MNRYFYDLHIHSCASPCAEDDMTPANIAGMASLQGLQLVALTDHNTCKNCPAFFKHAKRYGIIPVAGMELTTAEDIHVICLFPTLENAMAFDATVENRLQKIDNRPEIFGHQYVMNEEDEVETEIRPLLLNATDIDLEEAFRMVKSLDGVCYPAHIDRDSNGIVAVLGTFPQDPPYTAFELNNGAMLETYRERFPQLKALSYLVSSDAHRLTELREAANSLQLDDEPYSSAQVRLALMNYLRG